MELLSMDIAGARISYDEPMRKHTSLHLGGPADAFITPRDVESLAATFRALRRHGLPSLPLGGGTNLLVTDGGIEGAVVSLSDFHELSVVEETESSVLVRAGAGLRLSQVVSLAVKKGYSGLEGLAGIPGQVGGAIAGNAGAYGYEMKDVIESMSVLESDGNLRELARERVSFGYRTAALAEGAAVVSARLRLRKEIAREVSERTVAFLRRKRGSQPLGQWSAGCVFKNPAGDSAGRLIDQAGLKGTRMGDMEVSTVHANFFVNRGQGTAEEFLRLMDTVAGRVREASGVVLEPEVRTVGR